MTIAAQLKFPWANLADEPKRVKNHWDEAKEMNKVSEENGHLVPPAWAAVLLDVSQQRVSDLIAEERLRCWVFFGKRLVCLKDLAEYSNTERKAGRPVGEPPVTLVETYRRVKAQRK